ncbi:hypothetical protein MRX96_051910 [Rhipicephalus microplus]
MLSSGHSWESSGRWPFRARLSSESLRLKNTGNRCARPQDLDRPGDVEMRDGDGIDHVRVRLSRAANDLCAAPQVLAVPSAPDELLEVSNPLETAFVQCHVDGVFVGSRRGGDPRKRTRTRKCRSSATTSPGCPEARTCVAEDLCGHGRPRSSSSLRRVELSCLPYGDP